MKLTREAILDRKAWEAAGVALPTFDIEAMCAATKTNPNWMHFGTGNIFRAFPCAAQQKLLEMGLTDTGIIACETYDHQIIDDLMHANDNLTLSVVLKADGTMERRVIASIAESVKSDAAGEKRMQEIMENRSLQMVSFTVTEKAYTKDNPLMKLLESFQIR